MPGNLRVGAYVVNSGSPTTAGDPTVSDFLDSIILP